MYNRSCLLLLSGDLEGWKSKCVEIQPIFTEWVPPDRWCSYFRHALPCFVPALSCRREERKLWGKLQMLDRREADGGTAVGAEALQQGRCFWNPWESTVRARPGSVWQSCSRPVIAKSWGHTVHYANWLRKAERNKKQSCMSKTREV